MGAPPKVTFYEELVESAPDAIVVVDASGHIVVVNRQTEVLFGYARAELLGQPVELLVPERARGVHPSHRRGYATDPRTRPMGADLALTARRKDGTEFPVDISLSPISTSQGTVTSAAIRDVTDRERAASALQDAYEQLSASVEEIERHDRQVTLINEMGDMLQSCHSAEEAHEVIAEFAPQIFTGGSGVLFCPGPSGHVLQAVALWGAAPPTSLVLSPDQCWALRRGRVYTTEQGSRGPHCDHLKDGPSSGSMCVPMTAQGEALGLLCYLIDATAGNGSRAIESEHNLALTVAEHLSLALANLSLRETLRDQSVRDPLTGLFNRRYLEVTLEREQLRAARSGHPIGMIALDIDHFKDFNDDFGHAAGDTLLRSLGAALQQHVRGEDIVCRIGGEEFMVVLPGTTRESTVERARQLWSAAAMLGAAEGPIARSITISLGIAMYPDDGSTGDAVMQAADEALYAAKRAGRNRIVVAGESADVRASSGGDVTATP